MITIEYDMTWVKRKNYPFISFNALWIYFEHMLLFDIPKHLKNSTFYWIA